ncbi:DUF433 domain-containing protein [Leptolyngbyaceae cyanobacterium UHCC 1019]
MKLEAILSDRHLIHSDPDIMSGVPIFVGTRVPLQTFLDYLEGEEGLTEFVIDFPHLESQAIQVLEAIAKVMLYQERHTNAHPA